MHFIVAESGQLWPPAVRTVEERAGVEAVRCFSHQMAVCLRSQRRKPGQEIRICAPESLGFRVRPGSAWKGSLRVQLTEDLPGVQKGIGKAPGPLEQLTLEGFAEN